MRTGSKTPQPVIGRGDGHHSARMAGRCRSDVAVQPDRACRLPEQSAVTPSQAAVFLGFDASRAVTPLSLCDGLCQADLAVS
jgi:hypothetical protein